jgi:hypothetical protein
VSANQFGVQAERSPAGRKAENAGGRSADEVGDARGRSVGYCRGIGLDDDSHPASKWYQVQRMATWRHQRSLTNLRVVAIIEGFCR